MPDYLTLATRVWLNLRGSFSEIVFIYNAPYSVVVTEKFVHE